jgi:hypothetical protein
VRTLLAGELTQAQSFDSDYYVKLEVQNGSGTWIDVGAALGKNWIVNAAWGEHVDARVSQATFALLQQIGAASLSPLMSGSALNVNDLGAYAPLFNVGRLVRASTATMPHGVTLDVTKYRRIFDGRVDNVEQADQGGGWAGPITLRCSDLGAWLMDMQIETSGRQYGTKPVGTALETVLQQVIDTNLPAGEPAVPVYKQSTSNFAVTEWEQGDTKVMEGLSTLVLDSTGEDIRYRYDAAHASRLTWFNPDRARVTVDATFTPRQYVLRQLDLALANIRNAGEMPYVGGKAIQSSPTSIANFRRRFFRLPSSAMITTLADAQKVIDAVVNDLSAPPGEAAADCPFLWFVQLYDRYTFQANARQYDTDQTFAVMGYQHTIENGRGVTTLTLTARIVGAFSRWLRQISSADPDTPALLNFRITDTETTRTFTGTVVQGVTAVWVYDRVGVVGTDLFPVPGSGDLPDLVLIPDTLGAISYTATKPLAGTQRGLMFDPRTATGDTGDVRKNILDAAPSALAGYIKATPTNGLADLILTIAGSASNWPVAVDLYEDDPLAAAVYSTVVTTGTTLSAGTIPALAGRTLPNRALRRWFLRLTDVAGEVKWAFAAADRDPLPNGVVTPNDYKAAPSLVCFYDTDTDIIRVTVPGGKTKTFTGLVTSGTGSVTYTVGDALDDATFESALAIGETRTTYLVEYQGGGQYLTLFTGPLHGATPAGPSLTVTPTSGSSSVSIAYSSSVAVDLSINGAAYSAAPASPVVVTRPSAGSAALEYTFRATGTGVTVTDSVTIPALDLDTNTVTPDLVVTPSNPTTTAQDFTVSATNPSGGAAPGVFVLLKGTTGSGSVSGAISDGVEKTLSSGEVVTVNRAAFDTTAQVSATFRATIAGQGTERIQRTVLNQVKTTFGPSLDVTATPGSSSYSIAYTGSGGTVQLSIDGGAYATAAASPIVVTRPAAGQPSKVYAFRITADGQTVTDFATVPSVDLDTVTPVLTVTPSNYLATTQDLTPTTSNPQSGGAAPSLFVTVRGTTGSGSTSGALVDGVEKAIVSGEVITVNRPAFGTTAQASVTFRASIASNGENKIQRSILNQVKTSFGPSLVVTPTPGSTSYSLAYSGTYTTLVLSIDGGTYGAPAASPIVVTRTTNDHVYSFKATQDGVDVVQSVTIPAIQSTATFSSLTNGSPNYTADSVVFGWAWAGDSSATFDVYVREGSVGAFTYDGSAAALATSYTFQSSWNLVSSGGTGNVDISFYLVAIVGSNAVSTSTQKKTNYLTGGPH